MSPSLPSAVVLFARSLADPLRFRAVNAPPFFLRYPVVIPTPPLRIQSPRALAPSSISSFFRDLVVSRVVSHGRVAGSSSASDVPSYRPSRFSSISGGPSYVVRLPFGERGVGSRPSEASSSRSFTTTRTRHPAGGGVKASPTRISSLLLPPRRKPIRSRMWRRGGGGEDSSSDSSSRSDRGSAGGEV